MSERAPPPPVNPPTVSTRRRRLIVGGLALVIPIAVLIMLVAIVPKAMGWATFRQASGAMRPSLLPDDYFWVDGGAYDGARRPDYGDIVAVAVPARLGGFPGSADVTYVTRVIGLPGDQVALAAGVVSVNGKPLPQEPLGEVSGVRPGRPAAKATRLRERAPNGVSYEILRQVGSGEEGVFSVPSGHYFMLSDNRDDALDSRFWVQKARWYPDPGSIKGRATYIYWSGADRLDRIGTALK